MNKFYNFVIKIIKFILPHGLVILYERYYKFGTVLLPQNLNTKRYWDYQYRRGYSFLEENYLPIPNFIKSKKKKINVLDIGCGLGESVNFLSKNIFNSVVSGADISTVAIKKARKKYPNFHFFKFDLTRDILIDEYDYILLIETLEHISKPYEVVDKLLKKTRISILISVPYSPKQKSGLINKRGLHVFSFNDESFKSYNYSIIYKDILHSGTMPRIIYEIKSK